MLVEQKSQMGFDVADWWHVSGKRLEEVHDYIDGNTSLPPNFSTDRYLTVWFLSAF